MKRSPAKSLVETIANVALGYGVAVVTQMLIFPAFGLHKTLAQNLKMGPRLLWSGWPAPSACGGASKPSEFVTCHDAGMPVPLSFWLGGPVFPSSAFADKSCNTWIKSRRHRPWLAC